MAGIPADGIIIRVEGLTAGFGERTIVENLSFQVRRGEVFVILGGSGCGKTTVLKQMIGLYQPWAGKIVIDGCDLADAEGEARRAVLSSFGVMYQQGALFGSMTVLDNVRLPLDEFTDLPAEAKDLVALMKLQLVGLRAAAGRMPAELSGGMRKRVAIARAMALDPEILFLDEPAAGLDPVTSSELDQLILGLRRDLEITFVVVTHELASIFAIADRAIMLDASVRGILDQGTPVELRDQSRHPEVRRFFGRTAEAVS